MRRFALFSAAGALAFIVDAGVLHLAIAFVGIDLYLGRVLSFTCAATTTWLFNRTFTFFDSPRKYRWPLEWGRYIASQLGGFSVNYGIYAFAVWWFDLVRDWPVIGVAAGSAGGLVVNYALARRYVFRHT